jgi:hypothetical protein
MSKARPDEWNTDWDFNALPRFHGNLEDLANTAFVSAFVTVSRDTFIKPYFSQFDTKIYLNIQKIVVLAHSQCWAQTTSSSSQIKTAGSIVDLNGLPELRDERQDAIERQRMTVKAIARSSDGPPLAKRRRLF